MGYDITIIAERYNREILDECGADFVRIMRWPIKGAYRRTWFDKRVQHWLRANPYDLFFSHGDSHSNDILVMHNCVRLHEETCGTPELDVAAFHDSVISAGDYRALITNSKLMADDFQQRYSVPNDKLRVFYQGVDTSLFNVSDKEALRCKARRELQLPETSKVVGLITSGDFTKRNVRFFLEVAGFLAANTSFPIEFLVVGKSNSTRFADQMFSKRPAVPDSIYRPGTKRPRTVSCLGFAHIPRLTGRIWPCSSGGAGLWSAYNRK